MASSPFGESLTLATSHLQSLYNQLPPSLQSYIDTASKLIHGSLPHQASKIPQSSLEKFSSLLAISDSTKLASILLPLLALLFFMSGRFWPSSGGRYSPFLHTGGPPPRVTEDDYHYIVDDGDEPSGRYRNDSYGFPASQPSHRPTRIEPNLSPDILILKHKGITYPLHFPAFDISEGHLKIRDVRRLAARETKTDDPRRIKMIYKGKTLNNDFRPCKDENLKQNSEIMLVVSSEPYRDDGNESSSSASSGMIANGLDSGPRIDVDGTVIDNREPRKRKNHRGGRKKKGNSTQASPRDSGYLAPPGAGVHSTSANGTPTPTSRQPSPSSTRRIPSPAPAKTPQTPTEKLDFISENFHRDWIPLCSQFMEHPPTDAKTRDLEYKKLSEGILAQVILKLDEVVTEGDAGLRARRKELITETQSWLTELDRAMKRMG